MIHRIEVSSKKGVRDSIGEKVRKKIITHLGLNVKRVETIDVYTIDADIEPAVINRIAKEAFCDPIVQDVHLDRSAAFGRDFDWLIEVGFRPGVTDNVGRTARESVELMTGHKFGPDEGVYTSKIFLIRGAVSRSDVQRIAKDLLANELIQRWSIMTRKELENNNGRISPYVPKVTEMSPEVVEEIDLEIPDEELMELSRDRVLALSLDEMHAIRDYLRRPDVLERRQRVGLGRKITDVELECIAQTWSEHCKHKIFNAIIEYTNENGEKEIINSLFETYIKGATEEIRRDKGGRDLCLSIFSDNAGVVKFDDNWNLVFKVETHNSPSALDPYGGALTGIVGVNRDPLGTGKGAKLIFNTDVFCFASPFYDKPLPPRLLHPRRIFDGVREGVEHGGNKSGIPTVNGSIVFDDRYLGKPLVYCGTGGIMPSMINGEPSHVKGARPGDIIIMCGGRIGKDGIHGATFSSEELHSGSPATAVQIGDPITQKRMVDFLMEARDRGLYNSITDNGAGGLSSSVGEMARESGGAKLHLERAPLKYQGLMPWEILLSEAQERMTLAVHPDRLGEFLSLARTMSVEATPLGEYNDSGIFHVLHRGRTVAYLDMDFLHNGLPKMKLRAEWTPPPVKQAKIPHPGKRLDDVLKRLLARLNICSKEFVVRQYDHEVQGGSVIKPLVGVEDDGPSDAAVLRPVLDSNQGIVVAHGICPRYSDIDTYWMMACAIDEAIRNAVAVGADPERLFGLDNFCWCDPVESEKNPDGRYKLAQLVRANKALYRFTKAFGVPCISGKDSMKNDYIMGDIKISIPPTVLFSILGIIEDVELAISMDAKAAGDLVYVVGTTREELGRSEYSLMAGNRDGDVPKVDAETARRIYTAIHRAMLERLVRSCHDASDGGLGVAMAETAFAGGRGMAVDLRKIVYEGTKRDDYILFSESQSRFVATVAVENKNRFEKILEGIPFSLVGTITDEDRFIVTGLQGDTVIDSPVKELKKAWKSTLDF